ncbi:DUF4129 domain-containing protein [Tessaracoccus sp. G1721]
MDAPTTARPGRTLLLAVAGALVVLVLVALGAVSPRPAAVEIIPRPAPTATPPPASPPPFTLGPPPSPLFPMPDGEPLVLPEWADDVVQLLAAAAVLALIVAFLVRLNAELVRTDRRHAADPTGREAEIPEIDDEELAEALTETVESLRQGVPVSGAIVECWRRLERVAASSGIWRKPTQTSHEFTAEVLGHAVVDADAISELAELYRQAMFSTHRLTDAHRDRAIAALDAVTAQLRKTPS